MTIFDSVSNETQLQNTIQEIKGYGLRTDVTLVNILRLWYQTDTIDNGTVVIIIFFEYTSNMGGSNGYLVRKMAYKEYLGYIRENINGVDIDDYGYTKRSDDPDVILLDEYELSLLTEYYPVPVTPFINLIGDNPYEQVYGTPYTDPGYTILDSNDTDVPVEITGTVDVNTLGQYTLTYSSTTTGVSSVNRRVDVVDNIDPVIVLEGDNPYVIEPNSTYTEPGYTATDNRDGNITNDVIITGGDIDTSTVGINTVKYTVTDAVGNTTEVTRLVQVGNMNDSVLPVITLLGNNPFYLDRNSVYQEPGYTAQDQVDLDTASTDITSSVEVTSNIDNSTMGEYEVIYSVTDGGGNTSRVTRTVIVQAGGLMEVETYTEEVYFTVDITNGIPIMISNTHIKSNFDVAYRAENSGRSVVGIHRIWVEKGTGSSGLIYASPVVYLWVFYSHKADNSEEISYESRKMNYNLQINEWTYTSELLSGTIRSTGITTFDEVNLIRIYSNMPQVPMFSKYQARKLSSLILLKEQCVDLNISVIPTENIDNIIILELWYDIRTSSYEYVECIAYIQITRDDNEAIEYKTFYITYNNDTKLFAKGIYNVTNDIVMVNSTADDNKLNDVLSGLGKQIDIYDSDGNLTQDDYHSTFYTKPTGTSVHSEGIRFIDNTIQTTAMPPIGTVLMYACEGTPPGWLDCDGTLFSNGEETDMIDLFNIIGYTYGGDGESSFRVPDLNGRFPMGSDSTLADNDSEWDYSRKQGGNDLIKPTQFVHKHTANANNTGNILNGLSQSENALAGNGGWRWNPDNTATSNVSEVEYNSNTTSNYYPSFTKLRFIIKK